MSLSPSGIQALELKREIKNLSQERDLSLSSLSLALPLSLQNESLVDQDGFPRSDVDLFAVRGARNQVSCLSNDLQDINQKIDRALQHLHSLGQEAIEEAIQADRKERELTSSSPSLSSTTKVTKAETLLPSLSSTTNVTKTEINTSISTISERQPLQTDSQLMAPFAEIDAISPDSPAWECGLRRGDRIVQLGDAKSMTSVPSEVSRYVQEDGRTSQRIPLKVKLLREGNMSIELDLFPRRWSGQGVLGCHIIPFTLN